MPCGARETAAFSGLAGDSGAGLSFIRAVTRSGPERVSQYACSAITMASLSSRGAEAVPVLLLLRRASGRIRPLPWASRVRIVVEHRYGPADDRTT